MTIAEIEAAEALFCQYSEQKQEEIFLDLLHRIEDKGKLYFIALALYEQEEKKRKEAGNIISINFRKQ